MKNKSKKETKTNQTAELGQFQKIYNEADEAGKKSANACIPTPMVLQECGLFNEPIKGGKTYHVPDGPCGFAWINVKPGNSPFANWLKANDLADKDSYYGGVTIWVGDYNQSIELKESYANTFAEVLRKHGINAYANSRLD